MECRFAVQGRRIVATAEQVEAALRDVIPEKVQAHSVEIGGRVYPVKQALAVAFGLRRADYSPYVARRVFEQLGFRVTARSRRPNREGIHARPRRALSDRSQSADITLIPRSTSC